MEVGMQPVRPHKRAETSAHDVFFIFEWVTRAATLAHERLPPSIDKLSPVIDFVNYLPRMDAGQDGKAGAIQNSGRIAERSSSVPGRPVAGAALQRKGRNESKSTGP